MRAKLADAMLLRIAFALALAIAGATGAVSVTLLLRMWRIWDVSPTTSAVASLASACFFGVLCFRMPQARSAEEACVLSPARRRALMIAVLVLFVTTGWALVIAIGGMLSSLLERTTFAIVLAFVVVTHGAAAVIIGEMMRSTVPGTFRWSDRRHFTGVGVVWVLFSGTGAILLWRVRQKFSWP